MNSSSKGEALALDPSEILDKNKTDIKSGAPKSPETGGKNESLETQVREILSNLASDASKASQSVFARLRKGASSVANGAARLLSRAVGSTDNASLKEIVTEISSLVREELNDAAKEPIENIKWGASAEGRGQIATMAGEAAADALRNEGEFGASIIEESDIEHLAAVAGHPIDAAVGTAKGVAEHIGSGAVKLGKDFGAAISHAPEAAYHTAKDVPGAIGAGVEALSSLPSDIIEGALNERAIAEEEFNSRIAQGGEVTAEDLKNPFISTEALKMAKEIAEHPIDAAVGTAKGVAEHIGEGAMEFGKDLGTAIVNAPEAAYYAATDLLEGFLKGFKEIGKVPGMIAENRRANRALEAMAAEANTEAAEGKMTNDTFVETTKGIYEGLKKVGDTLAEQAGKQYRDGKENVGARLDQAVEVIGQAQKWIEGVFKYQKENKSQLIVETIKNNDTLQGGLEKLRLDNAKRVVADPERLKNLVEQGVTNATKEGLPPEEATARAESDATIILQQEGKSNERITSAFKAVQELSKLETSLPDTMEEAA